MKTLRILLKTAALLIAACFSVNLSLTDAEAKTDYNELYPMSCSFGQYEVAALNSSGGFDKKLCTSNFSAAKSEMAKYGDAGVIRHASSGSASKIINMNAGVVYSYPQRNGTNIAIIDQYVDGTPNEKTTYVTVHREMRYLGLHSWNGEGDGKVHVVLTGFDGYISLSNVDLVPMAAVTNDIPMYLGGNDTTGLDEYPFLTHVQQAYYKAEKHGRYIDLVYHCFTGWGGKTTWPAEWTFAIGPAPEWMSEGSVYFSDDGTTFYYDRYFREQAGIYYPYYQFLPLRTKTGVSAKALDRYISDAVGSSESVMRNTGKMFVENGETYGMNALLVFAIGCLESGNGRSDYARNRNNLFGIAAYDTNPDAAYYFPSVSQCVREEMGILLRGYTDVNNINFFGPQLGNKGSGVNVKYAGDPYWGMKIAAIAYAVDKLDNNEDGTLTDYNTASLGVIRDDKRVDILKSAKGGVLYNSAYGATYQKNHMVTMLDETDGYYRIQSTCYLSGGKVRSVKNEGLLTYDWSWSGYLSKDLVEEVNSTAVSIGELPEGDFIAELTGYKFSDDAVLSVEGKAYQPGIRCDGENRLSYALCLLDETYREVKRAALSSLADEDESTFFGEMSLKDVKTGVYYLKLISTYAKTPEYNNESFLTGIREENAPFSTLGNEYEMLEGSDASLLSIREASCGPNAVYDEETHACICMEGYEKPSEESGCTVIPGAENADLYQMVSSFDWKDETTVHISGSAFFAGMNAGKDDPISHTLLLVNSADNTVLEYPAESRISADPVDLADGCDYSLISYEADIPADAIGEGTYSMKIRVRNGERSGEAILLSNRIDAIEDRVIDGWKIRASAIALSNYRLELSKEKNDIDFSLLNKPTKRGSVYAENSLELGEDGILSMDGTAIIFGTEITAKTKPEYRILLVDESGKVTAVPCTAYESEEDPADLLGLETSLKSANFKADIDLKALKPGSYRMYLDLKTETARDIFELYNYRRKESLSFEDEARSAVLSVSPVHSRYEITVHDLTLAH